MSYSQQQAPQLLHSSVIPHLTHTGGSRKSRPISHATSIASSSADYDYDATTPQQSRVSRAPVYTYSRYADMEIPEDEEYDNDEESAEWDSLYSKTKRMNMWLAGDGERNSVGSDGTKTASTCEEVSTPTTPPIDFGTREMVEARPIMGPRGPHLFRSMSSSSSTNDMQMEVNKAQVSPIKIHPVSPKRTSPRTSPTEKLTPPKPWNKNLDVNHRPMSSITIALEDVQIEEVENWSTAKVCDWMESLGFDEALIAKFRHNDISGAILMELQWEDLKELDIQSFGKRIELWSELNHLRKSPALSGTSPNCEASSDGTPKVGHTPPLLSRQASKRSRESNISSQSTIRASPSIRQSSRMTNSAAPILKLQIPGQTFSSSRGIPISLEEAESEIEDSAAEDFEDVTEDEDDGSYYEEELSSQNQHTIRDRRQKSALRVVVPGSGLNPSGSIKSGGSRTSSKGNNSKSVGNFSASRASKRRVRLSTTSIPSTPVSSTSRMIDIFAAPSLTGNLMGGRRISMLAPDSPKWAPSICASSDVLGRREHKDMQLKADELRKVAMVSSHEQVNKFLTLQHLQSLEEKVQSPPGTANGSTFPGDVSMPGIMSPRSVPLPMSPPPQQQQQHQMMHQMMPAAPLPDGLNRPGHLQRSQSVGGRRLPTRLNISNAIVKPGQMTAGFVRPGMEPSDVQPFASPRNFEQAPPPPQQIPPTLSRSKTSASPDKSPNLSRSKTSASADKSPNLSRSKTSASPDKSPNLSRSKTSANPNKSPNLSRSKSSATPSLTNTIGSFKQAAPSIASSKTSASGGKPSMAAVVEDGEWEDDSSGHGSAPPSPSANDDRVFSGEMKKRSNNWLRHDWTTHRVELKGTQLTIFKNTITRETLLSLDIADYSVVCATAGKNSFGPNLKSLKAGAKKDSDGMYYFQLVPSNEAKKIAGEARKEHQFAVASREQRIDWMRELMLAKAIKQKMSGFEVEVNGRKM